MNTKMITVTVPVSANEFCDARDCSFCYFGNCTLFSEYLGQTAEHGKYAKCKLCLEAPVANLMGISMSIDKNGVKIFKGDIVDGEKRLVIGNIYDNPDLLEEINTLIDIVENYKMEELNEDNS